MHDNLVNLDKCLDWVKANQVEALICCGDVTTLDTLKILAKKFRNDIFLVKGNVSLYDEVDLKKFKNIKGGGKIERFKLSGLTIGACHEPYLIDKVIERGFCDFIFYGHTHEPWIEKRGPVVVANPGTLSGMFSKACFAVLDTKTRELELKLLERIEY